MTWLLDTGVCVPLINRTDARTAARLLDRSRGSVRLCSVVEAELYFGAQNSSRLAEARTSTPGESCAGRNLGEAGRPKDVPAGRSGFGPFQGA